MAEKINVDFMVTGKDSRQVPESLVLHLSNGNSCGLAWFTVTAYELIPGSEPEIHIHAGDAAYILRFAEESDSATKTPSKTVFRSLCKREVESLKVGGALNSIVLTNADNSNGETVETEETEDAE